MVADTEALKRPVQPRAGRVDDGMGREQGKETGVVTGAFGNGKQTHTVRAFRHTHPMFSGGRTLRGFVLWLTTYWIGIGYPYGTLCTIEHTSYPTFGHVRCMYF